MAFSGRDPFLKLSIPRFIFPFFSDPSMFKTSLYWSLSFLWLSGDPRPVFKDSYQTWAVGGVVPTLWFVFPCDFSIDDD